MTAVLPESIGPYRLLRPIARGGMAEVYEVEDPRSGDHLALKLLLQTGGALPRFNREYEAMIRLNHPNIVRVYHYGMHGAMPWLTMELVEGEPIQGYAKECGRPGSERRNLEVMRTAHDLALALDHIHRRGLVHRDLKSANVLVLPDGRVKLIDFGTAKVSDAVEAITTEGEFIGTFAYASPEQLTQGPVDHRADLYALGVLLFRMATAKRPFEGEDLHTLARQHVNDAPPRPRDLARGLPVELEEVILSLLEKRREDRPQSGAEVASALERAAGRPLLLPQQLGASLSSDSLVGREPQMQVFWRVLDAVEQGTATARVVLISGPQGSGRQRVIAAVDKDVRRRGWRSFSWMLQRDGDPLDTLGDALVEVARTFEDGNALAGGAKKALEGLRRVPGLAAADRIETLAKAGSALLQLRVKLDKKPVLLMLRALQNAGPVGFEALVKLRERLGTAPVLLVGDLLESHDGPESIARQRLSDAVRVHLPPMDDRQVALLAGSLLHRRPLPGSIARRIHEASGGLPAYVEEVVRTMVHGGLLKVQGNDPNRVEWAQQEDLEIPVPQVARNRVIDQLAELPADRRRVLEVLAMLDGEGSATVVAGALQCTAPELALAFDDLERRGWVGLDRTGGVPYARWRQILGVTVVLEQVHPCRRRSIERMLVQQIAGQAPSAPQIRLMLRAGLVAEALARADTWSAEHLEQNRPETALEVLDAVIPRVEEAPVEVALKARLYFLHVAALLMARPTDVNTSRSLAQATRLGRNEGPVFEAELHLLRARIQRVIGHYPNFRKHLMEAWYRVEHGAPSGLAATVAGLLGWSNRAAGAVDASATWHGRARRIAVQLGQAGVRAHADVGVAGWQFARGSLVESERTAANALEVFEQSGDLRGLSLGVPVWAEALNEQCRFTEALEVLTRLAPAMRSSEAPSLYVRFLLSMAWVEVELCRLGRAQECVDELAATLRKGEHLDLRLESDLVWGRILLASGQVQDALHRLMFVRDRAKNAGLQVITESAGALVAEALWMLGDAAGASEGFLQSVGALVRAGHIPAAAAACRAQARAMGAAVDPDRIFEPVAAYLDQQPATSSRIERELARARFARGARRDPTPHLARAWDLLTAVHGSLDGTDQAVLFLHPWARELRLAGAS